MTDIVGGGEGGQFSKGGIATAMSAGVCRNEGVVGMEEGSGGRAVMWTEGVVGGWFLVGDMFECESV